MTPKDLWLAVFLSSIFPGIGQVYAGAKSKGYFFIGLQTSVAVALLVSIFAVLNGLNPLIVIAIAAFGGGFSLYNLFDAYGSAKRFNQEHNYPEPALKKKPFLAVFLSDLFPGLGQFYTSHIGKGIGFIILSFVVSIFTGVFERMMALGALVGMLVDAAVNLFIMNDAFATAEKSNGNNPSVIARFGKNKVYGVIALWFLFSILPAGITGFVRANFMMPYKLPTQSMKPTLEQGDRIFVNKWIYRNEDPKRGDLAVFQYPIDPRKSFLKRVAGLPGERLKIQDGRIYINGELLDTPEFPKDRYIYNREDWQYGKSGMEIQIPQDSYFMLGDHSAQSSDSRNFGFIPRKAIKAKAFFIYWPSSRWGKLE